MTFVVATVDADEPVAAASGLATVDAPTVAAVAVTPDAAVVDASATEPADVASVAEDEAVDASTLDAAVEESSVAIIASLAACLSSASVYSISPLPEVDPLQPTSDIIIAEASNMAVGLVSAI